MSEELRTLLQSAAAEPADEFDVADLRARGRRMAGRRHLATAAGVAVVVMLVAAGAWAGLVRPGPGNIVVDQPDTPPEPTAAPRDLTPEDAIEVGSGTVAEGAWQAVAWMADGLICVEVTGPVDSGRTCRPPVGDGRVLELPTGGRELDGRLRPAPWVAGQVSTDVATLVAELDDGDSIEIQPTPLGDDAAVVGLAVDHDRYPVRARALDGDGALLTTHVFAEAGPDGGEALSDLIDRPWPPFHGTYEIVRFDPATGRTHSSPREIIEFTSMSDWELRPHEGERTWVRDGQHCFDLAGPDDEPDCRAADGSTAPSYWLQPAWPTLIPSDGSERWEIQRDGDSYTARLTVQQPCRRLLPDRSCEDPEQPVQHGWAVRFGDAGIPYAWYERVDDTLIRRVRFVEITVAGQQIGPQELQLQDER